MKWIMGSTYVRHSVLIFSVLIGLIVLLITLYVFEAPSFSSPKWLAIISGLLTGLIVALFQTMLHITEIRKLDKYRKLGIQEILPRRNDRGYYRDMIIGAKKKIDILGVTAHRFLHHFANVNDSEDGATALLSALAGEVEVRILVASPKFLTGLNNASKAKMADIELKKLDNQYPNFKFAYYEHEPTHSIVVIDNQCIVGPIFPDTDSEHTPAIHLKTTSEFAKKYLTYFDSEWGNLV